MPVTRYLLEHAMNNPYQDDWMNELINIAMQQGPPSDSGVFDTGLTTHGLSPTEASLSLGANDRDMVIQALSEAPMIAQRDAEEAKAENERAEKVADAETAYQRGLQGAAFESELKTLTAPRKDKLGNEIARTPQETTAMHTEVDKLLARFGHQTGTTATDINTGGYNAGSRGWVKIDGKLKTFDPTTGQWVEKGATKPPPPPKTKPHAPPVEATPPEGMVKGAVAGAFPEGSMGRSLVNAATPIAQGVSEMIHGVTTPEQNVGWQKDMYDKLSAVVGEGLPWVAVGQMLGKNPKDVTFDDVMKVVRNASPLGSAGSMLKKAYEVGPYSKSSGQSAVAPEATPAAPKPTGTPQAPYQEPTLPSSREPSFRGAQRLTAYDPNREPYQWLQEQLRVKDPQLILQEVSNSAMDEGTKRTVLQYLAPHLRMKGLPLMGSPLGGM